MKLLQKTVKDIYYFGKYFDWVAFALSMIICLLGGILGISIFTITTASSLDAPSKTAAERIRRNDSPEWKFRHQCLGLGIPLNSAENVRKCAQKAKEVNSEIEKVLKKTPA